jgi:hypothetical protein
LHASVGEPEGEAESEGDGDGSSPNALPSQAADIVAIIKIRVFIGLSFLAFCIDPH